MGYVLTFLIGLAVGATCLFLYVMDRHRKSTQRERDAAAERKRARDALVEVNQRERAVVQAELDVKARSSELEARIISYRELQEENTLLKRDLQNIDVNLNKLHLDVELQAQKQQQLDQRGNALGRRYLAETVKSVGASLNPDNFAACKERLVDVIERLRGIGFAISPEEEAAFLASLRAQFEKVVRATFEREEQARIKAQMREEERLRREIDREARQLEREQVAIQAALDQALAAAHDAHSEEIVRLQARLAEAEAKMKRNLSMAEQTKAGHVYVTSNIGSFGEGVFKVGMTRRLEPLDRIRELGDASVPFPFDVHMMISCDDAPSLENALHRALHRRRVNRTNMRKEFFRTDLETILDIVRQHHGEVEYVADAEAFEYRQSLSISDEDSDYIENVFDSLEDDGQCASVEEQ